MAGDVLQLACYIRAIASRRSNAIGESDVLCQFSGVRVSPQPTGLHYSGELHEQPHRQHFFKLA